MSSRHKLSFVILLTHYLLNCTSAAVHGHSVDNLEREADGAYRPKVAEHYTSAGHNVDFDHEAIIGSVKEAEEYDSLSPEEAKRRLEKLLFRMDLDGDMQISREELKSWILKSFINLSKEEADERMSDADSNHDGVVTWAEYVQDAFGLGGDSFEPEDAETTMSLKAEREMWDVADVNGDKELDAKEFEIFANPEEHAVMHALLVKHTLRERDADGDGKIDVHEYLGEHRSHDKEWLASERDKFANELDRDGDGLLDEAEVKAWVVPDNIEIAEEEVEHLFSEADDDRDASLSFQEVLEHHEAFVGSEATDYGSDLHHGFEDEL